MIQEENKRYWYSVFSLFFQYILPFTTIATVYTLLYLYLKRHRMLRDDKARERARERARRTNIMLASISALYCLCWLPLNSFNLLLDLYEGLFKVSCCHIQCMCVCCV